MNRVKPIVLVVLFLGIFQFNLFSLITSRVEGTVVDEETGESIKNASVMLFHCRILGSAVEYTSNKIVQTNEEGYFKFDDLKKREYFLSIFKQGYATFGPIYAYRHDDLDLYGGPTWHEIGSEIERFHLKEGQIKHFKIKLEKESVLRIRVFKKIFSGIEPYGNDVYIEMKHDGFINDLVYNQGDEFQANFLKSGLVKVILKPRGYAQKTIENVILNKGETKTIDHTVDYTQGQVIYGSIIDIDTGKPMSFVSVDIQKIDEPDKYFYLSSNTNEKGLFWLGGFEPGTYSFYIYSAGAPTDKTFNFKQILKVESNQHIEINKAF